MITLTYQGGNIALDKENEEWIYVAEARGYVIWC